MLVSLPLVSLITFSQNSVTPTVRLVTRSVESDKPTDLPTNTDSAALNLLISGAEEHRKLTSLETTLDWRYLSKANLSLRLTSAQGQKALKAFLRTAQGTLTLTKNGQARLEVTTPGNDPLRRATTVTDTKKLYTFRYDNDGKLAAITERALAPDGMERALTLSP
ncbi:hypothetical protein [Armatimonas sp.]|uniref:hypothetical protein n=1 Tax=Armatimonas sp. TaxID=1872638 RepID=UPI00374D5116